MQQVYNLLNEIIESCLSFSNIVINSVENSKEIPQDQMLSVIKVSSHNPIYFRLEKYLTLFGDQDFQNHTHVLYKSFKSLERRQLGSHLEQLLTRINFNNYLADNDGFLIKQTSFFGFKLYSFSRFVFMFKPTKRIFLL